MTVFLAAHGLRRQARPQPDAVGRSDAEMAEDLICEEILLEAKRK